MDAIISDCSLLFIFFASSVSFEIYESAPTFVSLAWHSPDVTMLPDIRKSPTSFSISSDSPVKSASFTRRFPLTTTASAQICSPERKTTISSLTRSSAGTFVLQELRMTCAYGAFSIFIFVRTFFALICCAIPIKVFAIIIGKNVRFLYEPAITSRIAMTRNTKLKYVKTFSLTIRALLFSELSTGLFVSPCSILSFT